MRKLFAVLRGSATGMSVGLIGWGILIAISGCSSVNEVPLGLWIALSGMYAVLAIWGKP